MPVSAQRPQLFWFVLICCFKALLQGSPTCHSLREVWRTNIECHTCGLPEAMKSSQLQEYLAYRKIRRQNSNCPSLITVTQWYIKYSLLLVQECCQKVARNHKGIKSRTYKTFIVMYNSFASLEKMLNIYVHNFGYQCFSWLLWR